MRRLLGVLVVGSVLALVPCPARAQVVAGGMLNPYRFNGYFAAPGLYGMSFGAPSVGIPRTYTSFSSPYGAGYGYGYAPYGMLPGRFGVGLWRPGFVAPGYAYGASYYYRTFPIPASLSPVPLLPPPPVGVYAPGLGPGTFYSW
jgi:hypothetical protein